jgi:Lon protease-like protein
MTPLFPLNTVLFPDGRLGLQVFEVRYLDMMKKCIADSEEFGVVALAQGDEVRKPGQQEALAPIGTLARIVDWTAPLPALLHVTCLGTRRFRILSAGQLKHGLWMAEIEPLPDDMTVPVPDEQQDVANARGPLMRSWGPRGGGAGRLPRSRPWHTHLAR